MSSRGERTEWLFVDFKVYNSIFIIKGYEGGGMDEENVGSGTINEVQYILVYR